MANGAFEPGTNVAFYQLEELVCETLEKASEKQLKSLSWAIRKRGSATLVRELAELMRIERPEDVT